MYSVFTSSLEVGMGNIIFTLYSYVKTEKKGFSMEYECLIILYFKNMYVLKILMTVEIFFGGGTIFKTGFLHSFWFLSWN